MAMYIPGVGRMYKQPKENEEEYTASNSVGPVQARTMWNSGELPSNYVPVLERPENGGVTKRKNEGFLDYLGRLWDESKKEGRQAYNTLYGNEMQRDLAGGIQSATSYLPSFLQRPAQSAIQGSMFLNQPDFKTNTGSKIGNVASDIVGGILPFSFGAPKAVFSGGARAAESLLPKASTLAKTTAGIAGGTVGYEGVNSYLNGELPSPYNMGVNAASNVALGLLTHGAVRGGKAFWDTSAPKIDNLNLSPPVRQGLLPPGRTTQALPPGNFGGYIPYSTPGAPFQQPAGVQRNLLPEYSQGTASLVNKARQDAQTRNAMPLLGDGRNPNVVYPEAPAQRLGLPKPKTTPVGTMRMPDIYNKAVQELNDGIKVAQDYVQHNDILAAYPPGTSIEMAMADIKAKTGVDLPALMAKVEEAQTMPDLKESAINDIENTRIGQAAGVYNVPTKLKRGASGYSRVIGEPKPIQQELRQPTPPTAELENARSILRKTANLETAEKIFNTYPELKAEFKGLAKRVELNQASRAKRQTEPIQQKPIEPPPLVNFERQNAINILRNNPSPEKAAAILKAYPDLANYYKPSKSKGEQPKVMAESIVQPAKAKTMAESMDIPPEEYSLTVEIPKVTDDVPKALEGINVAELKDTKGTLYNHKDFDRNFRDVFKGGYDQVKKILLDPFDKAKGKKVDFEKKILSDLKTNVVDNLGIKKNSRLSALVQKYGEGEITLERLKAMEPNWQKVVEADKWFRNTYDQLIDQVNAVRQKIYPTNPDKLIPKRKDYYRHFKELAEGFEGLKNIFDSPANIDPHLAGKSDFTLPKTKWASPWQKRTGNQTDYDAVGGFLDYLQAASYAIHIDPHIPRFERLADELAGATEKTKQLNGFVEWLRDFSRDLAGKTNHIDRAVIKYVPGSRKALQALTWANNRIKGNVVLGKVGSMLAQTANIPNGIAFAKQHSAAGVGRALASIFKKDAPIYQSNFIKERFGGKIYREFNTTWIEDLTGNKLPGKIDNLVSPSKIKDFAVWAMETADRIGTSFVWNAAYSKGLSQKVADPTKYADNATRRLVAGRGIGEVPLVQKSKAFQLVAPFQLEVANLWHVMGDFVKTKDFGALATLFVANHMFNEVMKQTRGSAVVFDPIQAMMDAFGEDDLTAAERAGRIGGEILSNVPLGQTIAATLVDNEWDRKKIFGRQDPTRYGSGLLLQRGLEDPLTKLLLPFGGDQVRKTYQGIKALQEGGVYTKKGDLMYPIEQTTGSKAKSLLFGPAATPEAQEYFKQDRRPLTKKMTESYKKNPTKQNYEKIQIDRRINSIDDKINDLVKEQKKGVTKERTEQIRKLREQRAELAKKKRGA